MLVLKKIVFVILSLKCTSEKPQLGGPCSHKHCTLPLYPNKNLHTLALGVNVQNGEVELRVHSKLAIHTVPKHVWLPKSSLTSVSSP